MSNSKTKSDLASKCLTFKNIHFGYNDVESLLLNGFSFELSKSDHMVIKGDSGTGKTTIFRLVLGFEQPDEGEIYYNNQPMDEESIHQLRKETAWLPQDLNLGAGEVKDVVQSVFQFKTNIASQPDADTIIDTFRMLALPESLLRKDFTDLSTGQRQRVGIAICHLLDKPLVLLDEPTSALDKSSKEKVSELLFNHSKRTILSASHDPWWIEQCNTVVELEN